MENQGPPYHYNPNQPYGYPYRYPPHPGSSSPYPPPPNSQPPYGYPPHHHNPPPYQYPYTNAPVNSSPYPPPGHSLSSYSHSSPPPYSYPYVGPHLAYGSPYHYDQPPPAFPSPEGGPPRQDSGSLGTGSPLHHDEAAASSPARYDIPPPEQHITTPPGARYDIPPPEQHITTPPGARYDIPPPEQHITTPPNARYNMPPPEHMSTPPSARYDAPPPECMSTPPSARYDAPSPEHMSTPPNARYDKRNNFYGVSNDSINNNWEPTYPAPSAYTAPMTHDGPHKGNNRPRRRHSRSSSLSEIANSMLIGSHKRSLKVLLMHGNLDIWIFEAKNLPNMDMFSRTLEDVINRVACNGGSKYQGPGQPEGNRHRVTSDPYVSITVSNSVVGRTYVISNNENPVWMQHFNFPVAHYASEVQFLVKDSDIVGSQVIGVVSIPAEELTTGIKLQGTYPIYNSNGKPCRSGCNLSLSIQYIPAQELSFYHHGIGAGPEYYGVPGTYFPLRKGGRVTLYQDAHVPDGLLPSLKLEHGMYYAHGKCWHDIFDAIRQARRLIYITGWSIWYKVKLVRDDNSVGYASDCSLGELLRSKSAEGVRVLLLIWDDPTSRNILGYKTDGIMATHDEETRRFFKHSSVQVLLCPRNAGKRHSWMKQTEVGTIYTHHQKTVVVDADAGNNRRKLIAFVGGLDICDGRYDNPDHPIFRTLNTLHSEDYHNPNYTGSAEGCPREPWHDLHSRIDGPAAYDVLTNFEERWLKAAKPAGIKKLKKLYDDALLRIERIPDIVGVNEASRIGENDPESWHVQIFRSIDSNSVKGFPKDPKVATSKNLVCGKNLLIDMSIHTAYVKAIRSAQHFIYIENQYFIGSSYNWSSYKDIGANNLIPIEIALKIADKIRANERFAAYIVIPMWPEGVPTGAATQRILFWQNKTMQMMYEIIYKALVEAGLEEAFTPQDYLLFFCLGNREALDTSPNSFNAGSPSSHHAAHTPQALSKKNRRFMIYVHSKGMIVDDEFVIMGSANINQRSMEGVRDTEIAMGGYQPQYTWARKQTNPHGQIYGYRMSLWAEHTGTVEDCFMHPETLECVHRVKLMGELNWKQFAAEEVTEMRGHLMKYPVEVDRRGKVKPIPGHETFPDVGGNICGSFLAIQENLTI